jgi:hypothetical protein
VRRIVLPAPLAHATLSLTALTPRSRTVTPEFCGTHPACGGLMKDVKEMKIMKQVATAFMKLSSR